MTVLQGYVQLREASWRSHAGTSLPTLSASDMKSAELQLAVPFPAAWEPRATVNLGLQPATVTSTESWSTASQIQERPY